MGEGEEAGREKLERNGTGGGSGEEGQYRRWDEEETNRSLADEREAP